MNRIFIRKPTAAEKRGGIARHRGFAKIAPKEGYEIVYCPYGNDGNSSSAGYYYSRMS